MMAFLLTLTMWCKCCCQIHNEAPSLLSQHVWAAQEQRQKDMGNYMGACAQMHCYSWGSFAAARKVNLERSESWKGK